MSRKKKRPIGRAEGFYIESHFKLKDAASIAAELDLNEADVAAYLGKLEEAGFKSKERVERSSVEEAGYAVKDGTVIATPTSTMLADENMGTTPRVQPQVRRKNSDDVLRIPPPKVFR